MITYPAKKGIWILFFFGFAVFCAYIAVTLKDEKAAPAMILFAKCFFGVFCLGSIALGILPWFSSFSLDSEKVIIVMGPFNSTIPYKEITKVTSFRFFSVIKIKSLHSKLGVKIYPADHDGFLKDLEERREINHRGH